MEHAITRAAHASAEIQRQRKERLLAEVKEVLRLVPTMDAVVEGGDDLLSWAGRAVAAISRWDVAYSLTAGNAFDELLVDNTRRNYVGLSKLKALLWQAESDLNMDVGPPSVVIAHANVFEYFDELRKVIETAREDAFFVDAYLDAEFVPRYLPFVASGVAVRLLTGRQKLETLLPAVELFSQQHKRPIEVRSTGALHERYLFIDKRQCWMSGASFKDGAKNAPALLAQMTDAFGPMWSTYDGMWLSARQERG